MTTATASPVRPGMLEAALKRLGLGSAEAIVDVVDEIHVILHQGNTTIRVTPGQGSNLSCCFIAHLARHVFGDSMFVVDGNVITACENFFTSDVIKDAKQLGTRHITLNALLQVDTRVIIAWRTN